MFKMPLRRREQQALTFRAEFFKCVQPSELGDQQRRQYLSCDLQDPDFTNLGITRFGGRQIRLWAKYSF
jgi:hypothetical protein